MGAHGHLVRSAGVCDRALDHPRRRSSSSCFSGATFELGALIVVWCAVLCCAPGRLATLVRLFSRGCRRCSGGSLVTTWLSDAQMSGALIASIGRASMSYPLGHLERVVAYFRRLRSPRGRRRGGARSDDDRKRLKVARARHARVAGRTDAVAPRSTSATSSALTLEAIVAVRPQSAGSSG